MKYADILDIEWALRSAELRAKTQWDKMVIYKDTDSLLYDLHYDTVKELRNAQKKMNNIRAAIDRSNIEMEYKS